MNYNAFDVKIVIEAARYLRADRKTRRVMIEACGDAYPDEHTGDEGRMMDYGHTKSDSHEGRMTKAKLFRLAQMAQRLHDKMIDDDDLPEWVQDKVTTAEDRLKSAHDYISYKIHRLAENRIISEGNASVDYMIGYEDARDDLPMNSDDGYYQMGYADFLNGKHEDYQTLIKDQQGYEADFKEMQFPTYLPVKENYSPKRTTKMKISKRQLKRIIKEEKAKLLNEAGYRDPRTGEDLFLKLNGIVDMLLDMGMNTLELANELRGLADDVEDSGPMTYSTGMDEDDKASDGFDREEREAAGEYDDVKKKEKKPKAQDMRN
tara:strand:- start:58 stop:1014 length:957 start_codon:yes stop_codon:yes gene_type:complete